MFNQRKIKNSSNSVGRNGAVVVVVFIICILNFREKPRIRSLSARVANSVGNVRV